MQSACINLSISLYDEIHILINLLIGNLRLNFNFVAVRLPTKIVNLINHALSKKTQNKETVNVFFYETALK